ncbi:hypothetical protein LLH23_17885 [bacterium]|nr:hypothetical protein [bacterium]
MATVTGVYPEAHELIEDAAQRSVTVRNRFYAITHSLDHGGAITAVVYHHGSSRNLLLGDCAGDVTLHGGGAYSERHDTQTKLTAERQGDDLQLTFEGLLRDADGRDCGIAYRHVYLHRWGHVRADKRLSFPQATRVSRVCTHSWTLQPELCHYGFRPGAAAEVSTWSGAFGVCQWGRFTPGAAFDCPVESRHVPRYVCCADPGREGIEWFVGSDLSQWDYQLAGSPGHGAMHLAPQTNPPGVGLSICPLAIGRGGVMLSGEYDFRFFIGVPILTGRANRLFLHRAFQRKHWPTREQIHGWADSGIGSIHFHHDGDSHRDGLFWRDGSYPPFGPEDMAEYDRVIADCHDCGIRVATYFSNKELHPTVDAYQQHGADWARLPDDTYEQLHNAYSGDEYGAQMCLRSGWLDFHKAYIDKVLSHHALDGTYYDWNVSLYCANTRHVPGHESDPLTPGIGDWAQGPLGHWDMEELLDLVAWTRRRVGPEGLMIIHNTMVPMAATENYADSIVAMEWGYAKLRTGAPALEDLPLEWSFMGHRARGVIGYGCLEKDGPERAHRQMTMRSVLTQSPPWPVDDLGLEMFAPLTHRDLTQFRFADPRWAKLQPGDDDTAAAIYHRPEEALLVLGNLSAENRTLSCRLDVADFDLAAADHYEIKCGGAVTTMTAEALRDQGVSAVADGDGVAVAKIVPVAP